MDKKRSKKKRLTKNDVNNRLLNRGIVLSGNYVSYHTKSSFQCNKGHNWSATPANVLYGCGCPYCSGRVPLTNEMVNERLADRGLAMLGNYVNQKEKALFSCNEGHIWESAPSNVLYGKGCPICGRKRAANKKRLTRSTIVERLAGRDIELLGDYSNIHSKSTFGCEEGHTWKATPASVIAGNGCPHCSNRVPLTKEIINKRIEKRGIKLIGEYSGSNKKSLFRCSEGHNWETTTSCVIHGTGCPHCDGQAPLSKELVNERIADRGYIMLGDYINVNTKTLFGCGEGHTWLASPQHLMRRSQPTGCPYCSGMAPLTTTIVNDRIKDRGYILVDEFVTNTVKIRFRCKEGHTWKAKPNNVLNGRGCPECAEHVSDNNIFYVWIAVGQRFVPLESDELLIKFGITSERLEHSRIREVANAWKAKPRVVTFAKTLEPATWLEERASRVGRRLPSDYSHLDGYTEFRIVNKNELAQLTLIAQNLATYHMPQLSFDI